MDAVQPLEVFLIIAMSSLFSFGGGSGQIPVIQGRWVEPGLLAPELFSFALAITYLAPGPRASVSALRGGLSTRFSVSSLQRCAWPPTTAFRAGGRGRVDAVRCRSRAGRPRAAVG